ncbi:MAG TPA: electron transport complex subunit RsxC [Treponemataceae bacterium]|jgi:electron transport complex protein RnfC|nr:MAG: Electron transport complex protein RnfC [Spirochaetes bacterium ADurb.Bin269]HOC28244.1 electron transport complex subunit RsxC [Treponemataceae bacterium]
MTAKTFKGGVHPPERKDATKDLPVVRVLPSSRTVWIPVTQGGAPNAPIVKIGDVVARGQRIAESDAFMSAPVHASVSGTVKKIETHLVTGNVDALCVAIEDDGSGTTLFMDPLDPFTCTPETALERIRSAGLVGMGGAAFPTHVKLSPPKGMKIEYLIANGAECEPYLTIDERTMAEHAAKIVDGVAICMRITGATEGIIALEDNKAYLVPILEKAIAAQRAIPVGAGAFAISVVLCKTRYPQGGEKMLIKAVVNREVPSGGLPAAAGCVVQNVGTLKAISEAFREGKPLIDRGLTLSGGACAEPKNVEVPIGTLVGDLIPEVISLNPGVCKIVSGGPMMGIAMKSASFPVQKNTSGVLFLTSRETALVEESPCIGCGRCITICSCRLAPVLIARAIKADDLEEATRNGLMDCVECGTCAYVCPAHVKLVQHFRIGKHMVRTKAAAKAAAEAKKQAAKAASEGAR